MKNGRVRFAFVCLVSFPVATLAQVSTDVTKAPAKENEKKTCRQLMPTGTIMSSRVCNTAAGWQKFEANGAAGTEDFRRATLMSTTRGK